MSKIMGLGMANESKPWPNRLEDRKMFVRNLGWLLSQTREGIKEAYLDDDEIVHVVFQGGSERRINVAWDSYMAIIRDVTKRL